ncbi:hypothetical protein FPV67DRAFT_1449004 [Lyophyllum atratum]|nr:hypothetical protein FPV67DRAFT_1449004 [Lyophyllum atratum]
MATTTQNSAPSSRFSRLGLGLGLKSSSASPARARGNEKQGAEDEWYIPYSGPYEPPREPVRRRNKRDSWGDPIDGEDDGYDDTALASMELHKRYAVGNNSHAGEGQWNGAGVNGRAGTNGERTGERNRTQSGVSGQTVSSGMVDPNRASMASQRRSTVSSGQRPPVPSYINLDAKGGVGESPMPQTHKRNSSKDRNRASIAGLFAFGGQARTKPPAERGTKKLFSKRLSRSGHPPSDIGSGVGPKATSHRRSSSTGSNSLLGRSNTVRSGNHGVAKAEDEEDYYNSYYFSTTTTPQKPAFTQPTAPLTHPYQSAPNTTPPAGETTPSPTPSSRHPYAYVFPTSQVGHGPRTAPIPSANPRTNPPSSDSGYVDPPRLTFTEPSAPQQKSASANVAQSQFTISFPFQKGLKQLKNSSSTPDLRLANNSTNASLNRIKGLTSKGSPTFKSKDRWLSAETWCDALLFPRPRLKIKHDGVEGSSGRIVSPPESPVHRGLEEAPIGNGMAERGVPSRVLAHSRSLVDLNKSPRDPADDECATSSRPIPGPSSQRLLPPQNGIPPPIRTERPPRPKSWALDDLALPSPVPSLARVIEEGEKLESQRKQWQDQATHSFQNKRTRSMSRARSNSLTQRGRRVDEPKPSNFDFLAARACLGNQVLTPAVAPARAPDIQISSFASSVPFSKSSHSHSHSSSLVKTLTKSSKSHSPGHSRTDSWGRSAVKMAKTAACGLVGTDGLGSPSYTPENGLESMLRAGGTKVIRLADPAMGVPSDDTPLTSNSPTPSGSVASDLRIGIALTTPPLVDNPVDLDAMRLPAHPYAQGGLYTYNTFVPAPQHDKQVVDEPLEYDVSRPQDTNKSEPKDVFPSGPSTRQRDLPPAVPYHPYAQHSSTGDSYTPDNKLTRHPFIDSDIPPPAKMWAQLSPGLVREILPGDIQYSPFMSENGDVSSRNSRVIYDTVGVGEALAYAVREKTSKDSGMGTSGDQGVGDLSQVLAAGAIPKRSYRQPVQYDTTRPLYLSQQDKKPSDPHSAHTFASSTLLYQQMSPPDLPRQYPSNDTPPPRGTSTSPESLSPPHSPRSFGNPDDLDNFYDLFYKPSRPSTQQGVPSEFSAASGTPIGSRRRVGSGLTSLARQLSEEFEHLALEQEGSQYSRSSTMEIRSSIGRRPTDSTLEFVFEEASPPESSTTELSSPPGQSRISPFHPSSVHIPEDVESSRASSPLEPDEDETELFRVGIVESVSTPPAVANDHRSSYMGELSSPDEPHHPEEQGLLPMSLQRRIISSLQPPSADPTRSSYMTTSTASRMSGLSDFPAPPQRPPLGHMSLLTSYFDEAHSLSEAHASRSTTPESIPASFDDTEVRNRRLTFGGEEEIEELVAALSSHSHSTSHSSS